MKKGFKTTEFWVTVLPIIGTWGMALGEALPPKYAAVATAISASAYAISRGLAKSRDFEGLKLIGRPPHTSK